MNESLLEIRKNLYHFLDIFYRRKWYVLTPIVLAIACSIFLTYMLPKKYRSTTMIIVERQLIPSDYVKPTITSDISERLKTISQQIFSRTNLLRLREEFDLYPRELAELGEDDVIEKIKKNIELEIVGRNAQAFSISFAGSSPETVMNVTNRIASRFIEENLKAREQQARVTTNFLEKELTAAKKDMDRLDEGIKIFKEKNRGGLPSEIDSNLRTLDRLQYDLQANSEILESKKQRVQFFEKQLLGLRQTLMLGENSEGEKEIPSVQLQQLKDKLRDLLNVYTENYPDIIILKKQIQDLEAQISRSSINLEPGRDISLLPFNEDYNQLQTQHQQLLKEIITLEKKEEFLKERIKKYEGRVERTPMLEVELKRLMRDYEMSQNHYQNLLGKSINAKISENLEKRQQGERFQIIDPANLPNDPYKPNARKLLIVGGFAGIALGFGLAFLVEFLNPCFRKPEDFEGVIDSSLVISIPNFSENKAKAKNINKLYLIPEKVEKDKQFFKH